MKKGYHPYLPNAPAKASAKALELDLEEYDSSDDEAVNKVYLGSRDKVWKMYLEEKRQKELLAEFIRELLRKK
jgi:hypothetical protein